MKNESSHPIARRGQALGHLSAIAELHSDMFMHIRKCDCGSRSSKYKLRAISPVRRCQFQFRWYHVVRICGRAFSEMSEDYIGAYKLLYLRHVEYGVSSASIKSSISREARMISFVLDEV